MTVTQGTTPVAGSGVTGALGTITRSDDDSTQVTINQLPLYYFVQDTRRVMPRGRVLTGKWFVVNASRSMVQTGIAGLR